MEIRCQIDFTKHLKAGWAPSPLSCRANPATRKPKCWSGLFSWVFFKEELNLFVFTPLYDGLWCSKSSPQCCTLFQGSVGNADAKPQPSAVEGLGSPPCVFWGQLPLAAASVTLLIPTYSEHGVLNIHFDGQEARGRELLMTALKKIIKSLSWNGLKATCFLPCILVGNLLLFLRAWGSALYFLLFWLAE